MMGSLPPSGGFGFMPLCQQEVHLSSSNKYSVENNYNTLALHYIIALLSLDEYWKM